jgi:dTDP-4-amino-4,6-dideoxygalactose transaminase
MKVPFIDLKAQYDSIREEVDEAVRDVFESCAFAGGPFVKRFEEEFARYCRCRYALGVGSGTEALWLSLLALGIGPGDEVITVPNSFIATAEAISFCGATPSFVDIDERTYTMSPHRLEEHLKGRFAKLHSSAPGPRPRAVIPVHLFGQMADMGPIMEIAKEYGLHVIEDACQAHGAEYKGMRAGSIGELGCFSFYPGKNLGACGEAGAVTTNHPRLAEKIQTLRDHGQPKKYHHDVIGWNSRMDGLQGAILEVKLRHLDQWNEARRKNAMLYDELLADIRDAVTPKKADYAVHVYHIYGIRVKGRDDLMAFLQERNVSAGVHYPVPIHMTEAYGFMRLGKGSFPVSEKCAQELLSLPMFPELTKEEIEWVVKALGEGLGMRKA